MVDEETNEGEETSEGEGDSAPFRAMIARAEAAEAKLVTIAEEAQKAEAEAQQLRSEAMDEIVKSLDIPNLKEDLLGWVEGPVTPESVDAALKAKGLNFVEAGKEPAPEEPQPEAPPTPVTVPVSLLGQQVADAASGQVAQTFDQRLADAKTPAEVIALNDEAGNTVSYI